MAYQKLTKEYWNSKREIIEAASRGFNMLQDLPRLLKEAFPDLKSLDFGFFIKSDLPERHAMGWEMLNKDFFDPDEWNNSSIPERFGIVDEGGALRWNNNYLMVMGKDFRTELLDTVNERNDRLYQQAVDGKKYVAPGDPRASEMAEYSGSKLETYRAQPAGETKRGPGRPKKN